MQIGKWALVRIILIVVGLLYGTLHHFDQIPPGFNEGFTVLLLLLVLELVIELLVEGHKEKTLDKIGNNLPRKSLSGKLFFTIQQELDRALKPEEGGFKVVHKTLALLSYDTFWRLLVEEQERRQHPLHLKVIHSCDFEIWVDHPLSKSLIERHRAFTKKGGEVKRILCGRGPRPDENICKAAENMKEAGVIVFYYDMDKEVWVSHDFAWDFLHVEETDFSVIWASFTHRPHGVINEAIYLSKDEYNQQNLPLLWAEIKRHSVDFPFENEEQSSGA
jgi:hypothetical protein